MTTKREPGKLFDRNDDQKTAQYLRDHEDFFERHLDLLESLKIPHRSGSAVSLVERQLASLREKNGLLKNQLQELINNARENDSLNETLQKLTLLLFKAKNLDAALIIIAKHMTSQFPNDVCSAVFHAHSLPESTARTLSSPLRAVDRQDAGWQEVRLVMERGKPLCGKFKSDQLRFLFGVRSTQLASAALIPLQRLDRSGQSPFGIIAIANADTARFQANLGTVFLTHMGQTISCALERFLPTSQP